MSWLNGFKGRVETDAPLAGLTWFNLGGPARWLVSPDDGDALGEAVRGVHETGLGLKVLGGGANVLIRDDGFDGVVIRLDQSPFTALDFDGERVRAGAGVDMMQLAFACVRKGLSGLEGLAGIPGTVGGAVRMNAGGRYGRLGDVVEEVSVVDERGAFEHLGHDELQFGYRSCGLGDRIVVSAALRLIQADAARTQERFRDIWAEKKRTQPLSGRTAGSVFKNPGGQSAGSLIDQAGMKGTSCGGASVSNKHANFIVTEPGASSHDVLKLIDRVREAVLGEFGVELELEIDVW